jgi:plasmid stabilization system protein ParE
MGLQVVLTEHAEQDLEDIYDYISASDSPQNADYDPRSSA